MPWLFRRELISLSGGIVAVTLSDAAPFFKLNPRLLCLCDVTTLKRLVALNDASAFLSGANFDEWKHSGNDATINILMPLL